MSEDLYTLLLLAVMAGATLLTRLLPFLLFDRGGEVPGWVTYLGRTLPPAIMALLVVYCLRDLTLSPGGNALPLLLPAALAALLHRWRGNTLVSIFGATLLHILLLRFL